jgi:hypothetical protein
LDKSLVPRKLEELDRSLFRLVRRFRVEGFPIPLAMRFRFKIGFISFDFMIVAGYNSPSDNAEVIDMPRLAFESSAVLDTVRGPSKGYKEREEMRVAIASLQPDQVIRISPEGEESMRKLKRMVTESGKDIGANVKYVEDGDELLVFVPAPKPEGAAPRGRPKKNQESPPEA